MQKANSMEAPGSEQPDEGALARSAPSNASPRPAPIPAPERLTPPPQPQSQPRRPPQRGDTGHISFGGIVQSPSVATVAANIEAVGQPSGARVPDLMRVRRMLLPLRMCAPWVPHIHKIAAMTPGLAPSGTQ